VTIARALVNNPAIVWADEPTGALDSEAANEVMDLICRLNMEQGQTVVLVTHAPEVGERANRIVRMRDGRIEDDGLGRGTQSMAEMLAAFRPVQRAGVSADGRVPVLAGSGPREPGRSAP
jgi:ABC-type lipoprotein export system ATPase subunit